MVKILYTSYMITYLKGTVIDWTDKIAVLDVGGVGYEVFCGPDTLTQLREREGIVELWTHYSVKETAHELFGFITKSELVFFKRLLDVSGIGPRSALSILAVAPPDILMSAIAEGDTSYLTKVSGIGKKMAEKIILELRDSFAILLTTNTQDRKGASDAVEALRSLGYSLTEARDALRNVPAEITDTGARIKEALKLLS